MCMPASILVDFKLEVTKFIDADMDLLAVPSSGALPWHTIATIAFVAKLNKRVRYSSHNNNLASSRSGLHLALPPPWTTCAPTADLAFRRVPIQTQYKRNTNAIQTQDKHNTNTTQTQYKYNTNTTQIHYINNINTITLKVEGLTCSRDKLAEVQAASSG